MVKQVSEIVCKSFNSFMSSNATIVGTLNKIINELPAQDDKEEIAKQLDKIATYIFPYNELSSLFPALYRSVESAKKDDDPNDESAFAKKWLKRWVDKYAGELRQNLPSNRKAKKSECEVDQACIALIEGAFDIESEINNEAQGIFLSQQIYKNAANINGNLLEEYIDSVVAPLGWVWCRGKILVSVDFCSPHAKQLIQVKNQKNTSNSSTTSWIKSLRGSLDNSERKINLDLWFRRDNAKNETEYYWERLQELILVDYESPEGKNAADAASDLKEKLTEASYLAFLKEAAKNNSQIIYHYTFVD